MSAYFISFIPTLATKFRPFTAFQTWLVIWKDIPGNNNGPMPSSVIQTMHYDADTNTLRIIYISGAVYDYKDVPAKVFADMKAAASKGTFLNRKIKGRFAFEKIT
jgi:hypothetical protein